MVKLSETPASFEPPDRIEKSDPVVGGTEAESTWNLALGMLTRRDRYLLETFESLGVDPSDTNAVDSTQSAIFRLQASFHQGRMTTVSSNSEADGESQTLYFTPHNGSLISLWNGTYWQIYDFTERSLSMSGLQSSRLYDLFLYDDNGVLTLDPVMWSSSSAGGSSRAELLTLRNGVQVKALDNRRYLGTFYVSNGVIGGGEGTDVNKVSDFSDRARTTQRHIWNARNRIQKEVMTSYTITHTYSGSTWRPIANSTRPRMEMIFGTRTKQTIMTMGNVGGSGADAHLAVSLNSTNNGRIPIHGSSPRVADPSTVSSMGTFSWPPGFNYAQLVERATAGTATIADAGSIVVSAEF